MITTNLAISIIGAIISGLLVIVGYFLKKLNENIDKMGDSVDSLNISVATFNERFAANDEKNEVITTRLNDHREQLREHEKRITKLEVK